MINSLLGRWEGLMYDVEGFTANGTLVFESNEGNGRFTFSIIGDHEPGKPQSGEIRGKLSPEGLVFLETTSSEVGTIRFEGRLFDVKAHARAAIAGLYIVDGPNRAFSRGGTAIFWLYEDKN
jgi:hypothetical protein